MAAAAASHGSEPYKLQPTSSSRSAVSVGTFISSCPAGALDPPGLAPVAKVYLRPVSGKRVKKPSALDKHLRHVVLLQRANRQKAQQHAATVQHKHTQHRRFLDWGHRLRHAILHRGASSSRQQHRQERPSQPVTAPAAPAAGDLLQQQQEHADDTDHACADTLQSWKPVTAAAQVRELQESTRKQETLLCRSLPRVLDPSTLSTDYQTQHQQHQLLQKQEQQSCQHTSRGAAQAPAGQLSSPGKHNSQCGGGSSGTAAAGGQLHDDSGSLLDVDAFLDSLLQTASAAVPATAATAHPGATGSTDTLDSPASSTFQQQQQQCDSAKGIQQSSQAAAALHQERPTSSCSSRKGSSGRRGAGVPAWALSEAAAAEEEEETLLEFAEGLDFQELLQDLGDDELSGAFKALELADAGAAGGQADADRRWRQSFVSALNAAAMRGIADHNAAAAGAGAGDAGSQQGDRRSFLSSASALRRAEAAATRREQLLQKLHRLTGTQPPAAAAAAAAAGPGMLLEGGSKAGGSVCGSTGSRLGMAAVAGAAGAGCDSWDSSTVVSSTAEDVGVLRSAIKRLEAGEVLAENPEMRGVHSTASVRSMLSRLDAQRT